LPAIKHKNQKIYQIMKKITYLLAISLFWASCATELKKSDESSNIDERTVKNVISLLEEKHGSDHSFRIERGVERAASLWRDSDGNREDFEKFCLDNFIADQAELDLVFDRLANNFEYLYGYLGRISVELNRQIHEDRGSIHRIDQMFGAWSPGANVQEDFFNNKIAFLIVLNFPNYTLDEKNELGGEWTDRQWGYARLGDFYTARVPAEIIQENSAVYSAGRLYISEYNIFAGKLVNDKGETLSPKTCGYWHIGISVTR
jgi:hypothetical protein